MLGPCTTLFDTAIIWNSLLPQFWFYCIQYPGGPYGGLLCLGSDISNLVQIHGCSCWCCNLLRIRRPAETIIWWPRFLVVLLLFLHTTTGVLVVGSHGKISYSIWRDSREPGLGLELGVWKSEESEFKCFWGQAPTKAFCLLWIEEDRKKGEISPTGAQE